MQVAKCVSRQKETDMRSSRNGKREKETANERAKAGDKQNVGGRRN